MATKHKPFRSSLKVNWTSQDNPLISIACDVALIPPKSEVENKKVELKSACPSCHATDDKLDAVILKQKMLCPNDASHGPFGPTEVVKAIAIEKNRFRVVATHGEVVEERHEEDVDKDAPLVLTAYDAVSLERSTFPAGPAYVMVPNTHSQGFGFLLALVGPDGRVSTPNGFVTLIGEANLKGHVKLVQVRRWNDQLVLQELVRPTDIKVGFDSHEEELSEKSRQALGGYFADDCQTFDPDNFGNQQRTRMAAFMESRLESGPNADVLAFTAKTEVAIPRNDDDLMALLEGSVKDAAKKNTKKAS